DLDILLKEIGDARIVLLGESTHGTSEYYTWRTAISKRLIQEKGFDFIAVEGDWDDCYKVNEFIKGPPQDSTAVIHLLQQYNRWPTWMWSNHEIASLVHWLNQYNQNKSAENKTGFYGMDVYSFWKWTENFSSDDSVLQDAAAGVKKCFSSYENDALKYASAVRKKNADCRAITENLWNAVRSRVNKKLKSEENFILHQHAVLALNGERYFRTMVSNRAQSWNIRDRHMAETIKRLLKFHGKNSKAIIWAHNGHVGDAHYSDMSASGYSSIGEMLHNELKHAETFSVGLGTYKGSVMAGRYWDAPMEKLTVLPAKGGSWEFILHQIGTGDKLLLSKDIRNNSQLNKWIEFRAIGASFSEWALYGRSVIPQRFNAFVFIDSTNALHPLKK
ncbi:MAG: erythromycin esterase family protein, partial [Chitinophagaceae bacterium]|nr:erythromycin esterase family protein [Chitinophagaceae bacterium]